jgi:isopenicillin-N N-acyltransferase like protein
MKLRILLASLLILGVGGCSMIVKEVTLRNPKVKSLLDDPQPDRSVTHAGVVEFIGEGENRITVLHVTGNSYEMGYQHGKLLGPQIKLTIQDIIAGFQRFGAKSIRKFKIITPNETIPAINAVLDRAWANLAPYTPQEDLDEMQGLADGAGIPVQVIHRMHAVPDLTETSCSALLARDTATRDRHIYQLRILDYGKEFNLYRRPLLTVYHPTTGNAFINVGWIGFLGVVSGINEKNVAISEMGFGNPPGETLHGFPMPFLLKNVLRYADNADQAAAIVRAAKRTNSYVFLFGDPHGGAVATVNSAQNYKAYRPNEQTVIEAGNRRMRQFTDVLYAGHYEEKQGNFIDQHLGALDLATIKDLAHEIAMKSNLHTVIYDLTDSKIWVANRTATERAADRPYVEFSLTSAWTKPPAPVTAR